MTYEQFKISISGMSSEALSDIDSGKLEVFVHDEEVMVGPLLSIPIRKPRIELIIDTNQKGEGNNLVEIEDYYRISPDNFTVNIIPKGNTNGKL